MIQLISEEKELFWRKTWKVQHQDSLPWRVKCDIEGDKVAFKMFLMMLGPFQDHSEVRDYGFWI